MQKTPGQQGIPARVRPHGGAAAVVLLLGAWTAAAALPARRHAAPQATPTAFRQLLQKYCVRCHGRTVRKSEIDLSSFVTAESLARRASLCTDVAAQVRNRTMPPAGAPQPGDAERQRLLAELERARAIVEARAPRDPGPAPIHRLNRAEYNNTCRDLLGLDLRPADSFPPDDTAYGFDNVAAALTVPPILLEKYLDAAERLLDRAIVADGPIQHVDVKLEAATLPGARAAGGAADLALEQEIGTGVEIPREGEYTVRVRAWPQAAGAGPAILVLKVDGVETHLWQLPEGGHPVPLEARIPLRAGRR